MIFQTFKVGFFLASRQIKRTHLWTTVLIIFVMTLTFINLVFINGILIGLPEGASQAYRKDFSGEIILKALPTERFIEKSSETINILKSIPQIKSFSPRYVISGTAEANYKTRKSSEEPNEIAVTFAGIQPNLENQATALKSKIIRGNYLSEDEEGYVIIGSRILEEYSRGTPDEQDFLKNVTPGSKIKIRIGKKQKEVTVKGILKSKMSDVDRRIYFLDKELRKLIGRINYDVDEIAIRLHENVSPESVKQQLFASQINEGALIQHWTESQGEFLKDIRITFNLLGNVIGLIGLIAASITIFIVIFINAITRRKYIGIMKGIGISGKAIEISYILQSLFYSIIGSLFGLIIIFGLLQPYFDLNPIDFPFSDGKLIANPFGTSLRLLLLVTATLIAGYIPAKIVIKENTLKAILGR